MNVEVVMIVEAVKGIDDIFKNNSIKYLLMSGNVEMTLKFFVGMSYERLDPLHSYVCDKEIKRHQIDMLGFNNGKESFAIEFKCSFSSDPDLCNSQIEEASKQISKTCSLDQLKGAKKYIIHFINDTDSTSDESLNPLYIKDKYPSKVKMTATEVEVRYQAILGEKVHGVEVIPFKLEEPLGLSAVVIRLK